MRCWVISKSKILVPFSFNHQSSVIMPVGWHTRVLGMILEHVITRPWGQALPLHWPVSECLPPIASVAWIWKHPRRCEAQSVTLLHTVGTKEGAEPGVLCNNPASLHTSIQPSYVIHQGYHYPSLSSEPYCVTMCCMWPLHCREDGSQSRAGFSSSTFKLFLTPSSHDSNA